MRVDVGLGDAEGGQHLAHATGAGEGHLELLVPRVGLRVVLLDRQRRVVEGEGPHHPVVEALEEALAGLVLGVDLRDVVDVLLQIDAPHGDEGHRGRRAVDHVLGHVVARQGDSDLEGRGHHPGHLVAHLDVEALAGERLGREVIGPARGMVLADRLGGEDLDPGLDHGRSAEVKRELRAGCAGQEQPAGDEAETDGGETGDDAGDDVCSGVWIPAHGSSFGVVGSHEDRARPGAM